MPSAEAANSMRIVWELNIVSLIAIGTVFVGLVTFWLDLRNKAQAAQVKAETALACAKEAHERVSALQAASAAYREVQAERLVSREVLREVEDRLASSIERLGDRFDTIVRELLHDRKERRDAR